MDTTLINSNEVIPEYVYDPNEFNYLEVIDTVQGEWSELIEGLCHLSKGFYPPSLLLLRMDWERL